MIEGIVLIDKDKGMTSRDVVNSVSKIIGEKRIGHTGTLDPNASGLLVLCVGKATKLVELLMDHDKEYIAEVTLVLKTETLDLDSPILEECSVTIDNDKLIAVLNSFIGNYEQEVPIYSAKKVNGKKLYEYARSNREVLLPKQIVEVKEIQLLTPIMNNGTHPKFRFRVVVSKGTYIRSLVRDIASRLNTIGVMSELRRTRVGQYLLKDASKIEDIKNNKYKLLEISSALANYNQEVVDDNMEAKIKNGSILDNPKDVDSIVFFNKQNELLGLYKRYSKDSKKLKPWKMFKTN